MNFDSIELLLAPPHFILDEKSSKMKRIAKLIRSHQLEISAISTDYSDINLASTNDRLRRESINQIKQLIRLAHEMDINAVLVVPGYRSRSIGHCLAPKKEVWKLAVDSLKECCGYSQDHGVILTIENTTSSIASTCTRMSNLLRDINEANAKINLDVVNADLRNDLFNFLCKLSGSILSIHISDHAGMQKRHIPIGEGYLPYRKIIETLENKKYDKHLILELYSGTISDIKRSKSLIELESKNS